MKIKKESLTKQVEKLVLSDFQVLTEGLTLSQPLSKWYYNVSTLFKSSKAFFKRSFKVPSPTRNHFLGS